MGLGYGLARLDVVNAAAWSGVERLSLYVLLPALIIMVLASAQFDQTAIRLIIVLILSQIVLGLFGFGAHFWPETQGPTIASTLQSNVRWNTFVGLSLADVVLGQEGVALLAIAAAGMIPTANLLSVAAFEAYGPTQSSWRKKLWSVVSNPLILACVVGISLSLFQVPLWPPVAEAGDMVARAAIAVGLLCAGAAVKLKGLLHKPLRLVFWSLIRIVGLPLVVFVIGRAFGLDALALSVAIIAAATPTASNGVILAKQLRGDGEFAANLIGLQSVLTLITIPLLLWVFSVGGT